jgi:DNA-binding response OmpR family regulator
MRVLLVEDDRELAGYVRKGLEEEGDGVRVSFKGARQRTCTPTM